MRRPRLIGEYYQFELVLENEHKIMFPLSGTERGAVFDVRWIPA